MVQSFNGSSLAFLPRVLLNPSLLIPHVTVPSVNYINFPALRASGIKAVVFDKDNTLTAPYVDTIHSPFQTAWSVCLKHFGRENVVVVSNSAGTGDDRNYVQAERIENALGIPVLRHKLKKPADYSVPPSHFGLRGDQIAVVGDRVLTDIVYGNLGGMVTIWCRDIVTEKGDNWFAAKIRRVEWKLVEILQQWGVKPPATDVRLADIVLERPT
ncbi:hypothetical protein HDU85_005139 [Gaertneriomyces sp. JEL0708]|nr:hypothetical protein HDU85_005139 [Gaertneriomyces sp. JEL0708]